MVWFSRRKSIRFMVATLSFVTLCSSLFLLKISPLHWKEQVSAGFAHSISRIFLVQNLTEKDASSQESVQNASRRDTMVLEEEAIKRLSQALDKKFIILWDDKGMSGPVRRVNRDACGDCELTKNRSLINNAATGAVVFYYKDISPKTMPPISTRNPDQLYVFWNKEPTPLMRYVHRKDLDFEESYGFNATMTYRRDSDFFNTYRYHWIRASFNSKLKPKDILNLKTKTSLAIISDCDWTAGARLRYRMVLKIKSLGFDVDGFGKCFPSSGDLPKADKELIKKVRTYKFFFAFENSYHCTDYITEKFYRNSLFAGAVPIVLGPIKEQYEAIAPPGSFIFLEDYATLGGLIEHLRYLDQNDTAYLEYLRWRHTSVEESSPYSQRKETFCHLCRTLHGINVDDMYNTKFEGRQHRLPAFTNGTAGRIVPSLKEFLFFDEDEMCMERNETLLPIYSKYELDLEIEIQRKELKVELKQEIESRFLLDGEVGASNGKEGRGPVL